MNLLLLKTLMLKQAFSDGGRRDKSSKTPPDIASAKTTSEACVICKKYKGAIPISGNKKYPDIPKNIEALTGICIPRNTKFMCKKCYHLLDQCIIFRNMCQTSLSDITNVTEINNDQFKIEVFKEETLLDEDEIKKEITDGDSIAEIELPIEVHIPRSAERKKKFSSTPVVEKKSYSSRIRPQRPKRMIIRKWASDEDSLRTSSPELEPWKCLPCNKKFYTTKEYLHHYKYTCPKHIQVEEPRVKFLDRILLCDICGKTGRYQAIMRHIVSHNDEFRFKCDHCPFRAKHREYLKTHMKTHNETKAFLCTQCPYSSKYNSNLHNHIRTKHNPKLIKCKLCGQDYLGKANLTKHINMTHLRKEVRICHICQGSFNSQKNLKKHLMRQHKITNKVELTRTCQFHKGSYKNFLAQRNETITQEAMDTTHENNY